jgi:hypothetical protein
MLVGVVLWWLWSKEQSPTTHTSERTKHASERTKHGADRNVSPHGERQTSSHPDPRITEPGDVSEQVYDALEDGTNQRIIQCTASGLGDGVYRGFHPDHAAEVVHHILIQDGVLTALVDEAAGRARISLAGRTMATMEWAEDCQVRTARVQVRGRVEWPDGTPGAGIDVPACIHSEWMQTGSDGSFQTTMLQDSTCYLIAFYETRDKFGRGPSVAITADGPQDIEDVLLVLPGEDQMWAEERMEVIADSLADMLRRMIRDRQEQDDNAFGYQDLSPEAQAQLSPAAVRLLQMWDGQREADLRAMEQELAALEDPEEQTQAVRDQFLHQY